jgi:ankyrin repeat protein
MFAMEHSTPEIIHKLLDNGANVNEKTNLGWTPLMFSIEHSTPEIRNRLSKMCKCI